MLESAIYVLAVRVTDKTNVIGKDPAAHSRSPYHGLSANY